MKPESPVKPDATEVKVLILTWPTRKEGGKYLKTNYEVAKCLGVPTGQTLTSAPRGATRTPPRNDVPLKVSLEVFHVSGSYSALEDFAKSNTIQKYDVVLILGFEDNKVTGKAIPNVVFEQASRRKGFLLDAYGFAAQQLEDDGTYGLRGEKDFYESPLKAEWLKAAMIGRGYQSVVGRDLRTDPIAEGGPVEPFFCEYLYTLMLRDSEEAGGKPLVMLAHYTYLKDEVEPGCEGGPYSLSEYEELTKCVIWYMAEQVAKSKRE